MRRTGKFKKDAKRAKQQGRDFERLHTVIDKLASGARLPERYQDHSLSGPMKGARDCHVEPDWVLIYYFDQDDALVLVRLGSHSELFG